MNVIRKHCFYYLCLQFFCLWAECVDVVSKKTPPINLKLEDATIISQPCQPYDSCHKRCVKESTTLYFNMTMGRFNCFCDNDCSFFGDCCWDYEEECSVSQAPHPKNNQQHYEEQAKQPHHHRDDSLQCVVVDEFSKGSYWMVTRCADDWEEPEVRRKCHETASNQFDQILPVLGDTGWTYRNVFCALCNNVTKYFYWTLKARCVQSAPEEVLSGNPELFSYYLNHFCSLKLQPDNNVWASSNNDLDDLRKSLMWKKSLRPCVQNLIDKCPEDYKSENVSKLCESYQSIIISADNFAMKSSQVFKNPFCALCNGLNFQSAKINDFPSNVSLDHVWTTKNGTDKSIITCPLWILTSYYDSEFWKLDAAIQTKKMLPIFTKSYKTSSWVPPSFSVLIRFNEKDQIEMQYEDDSAATVTIPPQKSCRSNQIYDPFVGICRTVTCVDEMLYSGGKCIANTNATGEIASSKEDTSAVSTVTISISLSTEALNEIYQMTSKEIGDSLAVLFQNTLNATIEGNITIFDIDLPTDSNSTSNKTNANRSEEDLQVSVSFVMIEVGKYTEDEILRFLERISEAFRFNQLIMELDSYRIMVLEYSYPKSILVCRDDQKKVQYNSTEYQLSEKEDIKQVFVNDTNTFYAQDEFQLLDWIISIDENGVESRHLEESRVVVCSGNSSIISNASSSCKMYTRLNSSEYIVFENESLFLEDANLLVSSEQIIQDNDGYGICLDGLSLPTEGNVANALEPFISSTDLIISWITFGLTIVALASLCFTFLTYCLFSELRSVSGWNIMNLTVALFAALLLFSFGVTMTDPPELCTAITITLHYLYLATFFWNNVMAFDVWLTFGKGIKQPFRMSMSGQCSAAGRSRVIRRSVVKYMCYAWGAPLLLVAICSVIEFGFPELHFGYRPEIGPMFCWISNTLSNIIAFGVPLALILLVNACFFAVSIRAIHRVAVKRRHYSGSKGSWGAERAPVDSSQTPPKSSELPGSTDDVFTFGDSPPGLSEYRKKSHVTSASPHLKKCRRRRASSSSVKASLGSARISILVYMKLSTVMGFTWSIGFVSAVLPDVAPLRYVFEIFVPLQGVFIFVAFLCKRRTWKLYKALFKGDSKKGKSESCRIKSSHLASKPRKQKPNIVSIENEKTTDPVKSVRRFNRRMDSQSSSDRLCVTSTIVSGERDNPAFEHDSALKSRSCSESAHSDIL